MDMDKLAALRGEIAKTRTTNSSGWWKAEAGLNRIRIMPPREERLEDGKFNPFFWAEVGKHYGIDNNKTNWTCPDFTLNLQQRCPICEFVKSLYRSSDPSDKKLAQAMRLRKSFHMWIIDRKNEGAGPQPFAAPTTVFIVIQSLVNDDEYGDITDVEKGFDITIDRKGTELDTEYTVRASRTPSMICNSQETLDDWMGKITDLRTDAMERIKDYAAMESELEAYLSGGMVAPSGPVEKPQQAAAPAAAPATGVSGLRRSVARH